MFLGHAVLLLGLKGKTKSLRLVGIVLSLFHALMLNVATVGVERLKENCVSCNKDYWDCRKCPVWVRFNTPCYFCGSIPAPYILVRGTSRGMRSCNVCAKCLEELT